MNVNKELLALAYKASTGQDPPRPWLFPCITRPASEAERIKQAIMQTMVVPSHLPQDSGTSAHRATEAEQTQRDARR